MNPHSTCEKCQTDACYMKKKKPWLPYLIAQKHTLHSFTTLTPLEIFFFFLLELLIYMILNCWCLRSRLHKIYKNYFCLCCFTKQHTSQISVKFIWSHNVLSVYLLLEGSFFKISLFKRVLPGSWTSVTLKTCCIFLCKTFLTINSPYNI